MEIIYNTVFDVSDEYDFEGNCFYCASVRTMLSDKDKAQYMIYLDNSVVFDWCIKTFDSPNKWMYRDITSTVTRFYFKSKKDRDWFVLRWN